jgi:hypothetical protein
MPGACVFNASANLLDPHNNQKRHHFCPDSINEEIKAENN